MVLLLTACAKGNGYCVHKSVTSVQDDLIFVSEESETTCYDLEGNVKSNDE